MGSCMSDDQQLLRREEEKEELRIGLSLLHQHHELPLRQAVQQPCYLVVDTEDNAAHRHRLAVDVILILDCSESMTGIKGSLMVDCVKAFLGKLNQFDRVSIVRFNHQAYKLHRFSRVTQQFRTAAAKSLDSLVFQHGTSISQAFNKSSQILNKRKYKNQAVLQYFFSDGFFPQERIENEILRSFANTHYVKMGPFANNSLYNFKSVVEVSEPNDFIRLVESHLETNKKALLSNVKIQINDRQLMAVIDWNRDRDYDGARAIFTLKDQKHVKLFTVNVPAVTKQQEFVALTASLEGYDSSGVRHFREAELKIKVAEHPNYVVNPATGAYQTKIELARALQRVARGMDRGNLSALLRPVLEQTRQHQSLKTLATRVQEMIDRSSCEQLIALTAQLKGSFLLYPQAANAAKGGFRF